MSPIATPPLGLASGSLLPGGLNTPNGRFCSGNSAWPLAEATQLCRLRSWVSSIIVPVLPLISVGSRSRDGRQRHLYLARQAAHREYPEPQRKRGNTTQDGAHAAGVIG